MISPGQFVEWLLIFPGKIRAKGKLCGKFIYRKTNIKILKFVKRKLIKVVLIVFWVLKMGPFSETPISVIT